jgi:hypothetical protein
MRTLLFQEKALAFCVCEGKVKSPLLRLLAHTQQNAHTGQHHKQA